MKKIFLVLLYACTPHYVVTRAQPAPVPGRYPTAIAADSGVHQFLQNARNRQWNNTEMPSEELVACIYGFVRGDTAFVAFIKPTQYQAMGGALIAYKRCGKPDPAYYGSLQYLGTWHTHAPDTLWRGGCYFSNTDTRSFMADTLSVIEMVSCRDGLMGRNKLALDSIKAAT